MSTLTRKEIETQLMRLGIKTITELESFLSEYNEYYNDCNAHLSSNNS
jgi:predicted nuclease with TOPRIM domain